ncbi:MAG: glutamine-hydrolyzing GMP synthase [Christensenellaceae bacterium]|nr:glutamine-hydrolyzing GMP synthase [Christensenellaceae bacterium]
MENQRIVILDFGGQYTQLIARRIRECHVYSEVLPYNAPIENIKKGNTVGIILSGGPASVLDENAPKCSKEIFELGIPVLGICYGMQLTAELLGGSVVKASTREYGRIAVNLEESKLFEGLPKNIEAWMSHTYQVGNMPDGFNCIAHTETCPVAAMANDVKKIYGVQFHPEVSHTDFGTQIIINFIKGICGCVGDWTVEAYIEKTVAQIKDQVGENENVLLGLSGGVDSSVVAALLYKAIGDRLYCVYVDHGLMRKDESAQVKEVFTKQFPVHLSAVDASELFFDRLKGVTDPETKRKIIGNTFVDVFKAEADKLGISRDYFAQGTIYPDVIESGKVPGSAVIKSHHNVNGLPAELGFKGLVEPLRSLFKDEVRQIGLALGLPDYMVFRQPFPGPGLGIRVLGELTRDKVNIVRESDAILREEFAKAGMDKSVSQYFTVLTGVRSVGVMGDERTYSYALAIRAITTTDFMTADVAEVPFKLLMHIGSRIVGEVKHVNRVLYDITTKPPASIEWE